MAATKHRSRDFRIGSKAEVSIIGETRPLRGQKQTNSQDYTSAFSYPNIDLSTKGCATNGRRIDLQE